MKVILRRFIGTVQKATGYRDFVADVAICCAKLEQFAFSSASGAGSPAGARSAAGATATHDAPNGTATFDQFVWVVELNTPIYLLATAGYFKLMSHKELLFGTPPEDVVLPAILANIGGSKLR